jgi:1,3-beta-glucan synthase
LREKKLELIPMYSQYYEGNGHHDGYGQDQYYDNGHQGYQDEYYNDQYYDQQPPHGQQQYGQNGYG